MDSSAEEWDGLADFVRRREADIVEAWLRLVRQLPGSHYRTVPVEELRASGHRSVANFAVALETGSYHALEASLSDVSMTRLGQGFDIDEVIQGTALWKEAMISLVWDALPPGSPELRSAVAQLDERVRYTVARFGRVYAEMMQRRLYHETNQRLVESQSLQRVTAALLQRLTLGEVLEIVCAEAQRLTGGRGSTVFLVENGEWLRIAHSAGDAWVNLDRFRIEGTPTGEAVRDGQATLTNDPATIPASPYRTATVESRLIVPLKVKGVVIGAIDLVNKPGGFTADDLRIISLFADQAAIAIENARLHRQEEQLAVIEERQRLARDLHDSVTQSLYSVTLYAEAATRLLSAGDGDSAMTHLRDLRDTAQEAMREMRLLIFELRPPVLQKEGLAAAIQARLDVVEARSGLQTSLRVEGEARLPLDIEEELYRIAQEALNNVLKHARAKKVEVSLFLDERGVALEVRDDGVGFDPRAVGEKGGLGLRGMRERAERIGAKLEIESAPGQGTIVGVRGHIR